MRPGARRAGLGASEGEDHGDGSSVGFLRGRRADEKPLAVARHGVRRQRNIDVASVKECTRFSGSQGRLGFDLDGHDLLIQG
jgi:hypothetical protein